MPQVPPSGPLLPGHRPASERLARDVQRLRATLANHLSQSAQPTLVVISGLPGSGKSHFGRLLAQRLPLVILESDALRKALISQPTYSGPENGRLFRAAHDLIRQLLASGVSVLFDATNLIEANRKRLYRIADDLGARLALVRLEAPESVVYRRLERRRQGLDPLDRSDAGPEVYERMRSQIDPMGREHLVIDTSQDLRASMEQVVRWLASQNARPSTLRLRSGQAGSGRAE